MKAKARIKLLVAASIVSSLLLLVGAYSVNAANSENTQKFPPVVEKLVKAFNLDRAKVGEVLEEHRQERVAQHKARFEERLDKMVEEGTLTTDQKEAILKKMDELKTVHEEIRNLAPEQRWEALEKHRTELESWAKENGIDLKQFMPWLKGHKSGMRGFKPGPGGPEGFGPGRFGPPDGEFGPPPAQ